MHMFKNQKSGWRISPENQRRGETQYPDWITEGGSDRKYDEEWKNRAA